MAKKKAGGDAAIWRLAEATAGRVDIQTNEIEALQTKCGNLEFEIENLNAHLKQLQDAFDGFGKRRRRPRSR